MTGTAMKINKIRYILKYFSELLRLKNKIKNSKVITYDPDKTIAPAANIELAPKIVTALLIPLCLLDNKRANVPTIA